MSKIRLSFPFTFVLPLFCLRALESTYFLAESRRFYFGGESRVAHFTLPIRAVKKFSFVLVNPLADLLEWHRVLRPGGLRYLIVPDKRFTVMSPDR
jgi:hypothetical protein